MASAAILVGFSKFQIFNGRIGQECQTASLRQISRFELCYGAKPHHNRSTRYRYMAIFLFFSRWQPPSCWIFEISNFTGAMCERVNCIMMLHFVEISRTMTRDSILRCYNITSAAILNFLNVKSLTVKIVKRVGLRHRAEFCRNCSNRREICRFFDFSKWRPPP